MQFGISWRCLIYQNTALISLSRLRGSAVVLWAFPITVMEPAMKLWWAYVLCVHTLSTLIFQTKVPGLTVRAYVPSGTASGSDRACWQMVSGWCCRSDSYWRHTWININTVWLLNTPTAWKDRPDTKPVNDTEKILHHFRCSKSPTGKRNSV